MAKTESTKRRLRPAQPKTVRQAAEKAQANSEKPVRARRLRVAASKTGKPFAKIGKVLYKIFNRQPFRFIGKILRFIGLIVWPRYFRNAFKELRLVSWPNRRETRQLTVAVLGFAIIFGILVGIVDFGLDKLFKALIIK